MTKNISKSHYPIELVQRIGDSKFDSILPIMDHKNSKYLGSVGYIKNNKGQIVAAAREVFNETPYPSQVCELIYDSKDRIKTEVYRDKFFDFVRLREFTYNSMGAVISSTYVPEDGELKASPSRPWEHKHFGFTAYIPLEKGLKMLFLDQGSSSFHFKRGTGRVYNLSGPINKNDTTYEIGANDGKNLVMVPQPFKIMTKINRDMESLIDIF